jgi:hypothetical protein
MVLEANIEKIAANVISKNPYIQLLKLGDNTISKSGYSTLVFQKKRVILILTFG